MFNKRTLCGLSSIFFFVLFVLFILIIIKQSGFISDMRIRHFSRKITQQKKIIEHNIKPMVEILKNISKNTTISDIFSNKYISLEEFSHPFGTNIRNISVTDDDGVIIFTSGIESNIGRKISKKILLWSKKRNNEPFFFFANSDTVIGISQYNNPYSLTKKGYVIIEFNAFVLLKELEEISCYTRMIDDHEPITIIADKKTKITTKLASQLALAFGGLEENKFPKELGTLFHIPFLTTTIYFIGTQFHLPLVILLLLCWIFSAGILLSIEFFKDPISEKNEEYEPKSNNITELIKDINSGITYDRATADNLIEQASKFGVVDRYNDFAESQRPSFDTVEKNAISIDNNEENNSFLIEKMNENTDENLIEKIDSQEWQDIKDTYDHHQLLRTEIKEKLLPILEKYSISHFAIAEPFDDVFIFDDVSNFDQSFIINKKDAIYQDILSKKEILSLSGDLSQSIYLEKLFSHDILHMIGELFIIPVIKDEQIVAIIILARDKDLTFLSHEDKENIFTIGVE